MDLKSEIKNEQFQNKHLLDRSTERLAELEDLRQKLRNTDDVIGRLETKVADKTPHIIRIKKDLIDEEKQCELKQKDIQIKRLRPNLINQKGSIDKLLIQPQAYKVRETKIHMVIFF